MGTFYTKIGVLNGKLQNPQSQNIQKLRFSIFSIFPPANIKYSKNGSENNFFIEYNILKNSGIWNIIYYMQILAIIGI